jgi:hypothetical protein
LLSKILIRPIFLNVPENQAQQKLDLHSGFTPVELEWQVWNRKFGDEDIRSHTSLA